jgi:hypothetical protein
LTFTKRFTDLLRRIIRVSKAICSTYHPQGNSSGNIFVAQTSELNAEIHDEILQRAVELAKAGYPDNATTALQIGQRSE